MDDGTRRAIVAEAQKTGRIDLSFQDLNAIPSWVFKVRGLSHLDVSHNQLEDCEGPWEEMSKLQELDLSHNQLHQLPSNLSDAQQLEVLNVSSNKLEDLPTSFFKLLTVEEERLGIVSRTGDHVDYDHHAANPHWKGHHGKPKADKDFVFCFNWGGRRNRWISTLHVETRDVVANHLILRFRGNPILENLLMEGREIVKKGKKGKKGEVNLDSPADLWEL